MSPPAALQFEQVGKQYQHGIQSVRAVSDLTLTIAPGQVYGFLGHNGAGKTTTIRMILDLIRPTEGEIFVFGESVRRSRKVLRRIGALVEGATFYNFLSARENLDVLARTDGRYDKMRIKELLEQVGLGPRAGEDVKGFSTGMKQRLGLAAALLNDPDLVILDEPTNGLDPDGIRDMRSFVRELAEKHGKTVFLSSHLLNEVEQICDRVAIIHQGKLVREGAVADLLAAQSQMHVEVNDRGHATYLLSQRWKVEQNGTGLLVSITREEAPELLRLLVNNEIDVFQAALRRQTLEEFFMTVTHGETTHAIS